MSNSRRLGIVVVALVLAVAAFFTFRPADTTRRDEKVQTERERSSSGDRSGQRPGNAADPSARGDGGPGGPSEPRAETIRVSDGKPVGGVRTLAFESGDTVCLAFVSDAAREVHIHGYDRYVDLKPGRTVRVRFPAELEGIFEIEDHASGAQLAKLRVEP